MISLNGQKRSESQAVTFYQVRAQLVTIVWQDVRHQHMLTQGMR